MKKKSVKPMRLLAFVAATACALSSTCMVNATSGPSDVSKVSTPSGFVSGTSSSNGTSTATSSAVSINSGASSGKPSASKQSASVATAGSQISLYRAVATKTAPLICIDTPTARVAQVQDNNLSIRGWALGNGGVKSASIVIDGRAVASNVSVNGARPDVNNAFPGYINGSTSGFSTAVNISAFGFGSHRLTVLTKLNNGKDGPSGTVSFTKLLPLVTLDVPVNNSRLSIGSVQIGGWALTDSGNANVDILLDGKKVETAAAKGMRPDVGKVFPNYPSSGTSGFNCTLNIGTSGSHTVIVRVISDGRVVSQSAAINITVPPSLIIIDTPSSNGLARSSQLPISGWALGDSGVKYATVAIDGVVKKANIPVNNARPDVNKAFPGYTGGAASGFSTTVDISGLSFAPHTITVSTQLNNGKVGASQTVSFLKSSPYLSLEAPQKNSSYTNGSILVGGWALSYSAQPNVDILLDGNKVTTVKANGLRADVGKVFRTYTYAANSGFSAQLQNVAAGSHIVTAQFTSDNGTLTKASATITVSGVTTIYKPFNTTLARLASVNGVTPSLINPKTLFADKVSKYEFMSLYGVSGVTASDINGMLENCGVLTGQGQAVVNAAKTYNINPVYLAAHLRLESGNGTSKLATGISVNAGTYTNSKGKTVQVSKSGIYYNLLGIHAYDGSAVPDGSRYAASQNWNSVSAAISGGAAWISKNFINNSQMGSAYYDQPTLYEMKWDPQGTVKYNAQGQSEYATDTDWAYNIASIMAQYSNIFARKSTTYYVAKFNS